MPINISTFLQPTNGNTFFILEDTFVRGGFRVTATIASRDAIPVNNLKVGCVVVVQSGLNLANEVYQYGGVDGYSTPIWTLLNLLGGGSGGGDFIVVPDIQARNAAAAFNPPQGTVYMVQNGSAGAFEAYRFEGIDLYDVPLFTLLSLDIDGDNIAYKNTANEFSRGQWVAPVQITANGIFGLDAIASNNFEISLQANSTLEDVIPLLSGQILNLRVKQTGAGNFTLGFGPSFNTLPGLVINTGAGAITILGLYVGSDGAISVRGS